MRRTIEYKAPKTVCAACPFRPQCTRASNGRTVKRHEKQALLDIARGQAHSRAAMRDRCRRQHLVEGSFADAANNHHFQRARWRRLWRQQIQDYLIAAIQNVRILLAHDRGKGRAALKIVAVNFDKTEARPRKKRFLHRRPLLSMLGLAERPFLRSIRPSLHRWSDFNFGLTSPLRLQRDLVWATRPKYLTF
ncbi:MAG: transposase [Chthoniobacterales bacterium]